MFPYHDENETQRPAYVTMAFVAINVFMWVVVQGAGSALPLASSVCNLGLIPGELTGALPPGAQFPIGDGLVCLTDPGRQPINVLTSMFLHGSWMHLLGNMWFLWLFGNNVEDAMTRVRFVVFYLAVRAGGGAAAGRDRARVGGADGRRVRRDQRGDGRVSRALSTSACLHARAACSSSSRPSRCRPG